MIFRRSGSNFDFFDFVINKGIDIFNLKLYDIAFRCAWGKLFLKRTLNRICPRNGLIDFTKKKTYFIYCCACFLLLLARINIFVRMIFCIDNTCQLFPLCM